MSVWTDMLTMLRSDAELATVLSGGIWDRPLNPNDAEMQDVVWRPHSVTDVKRLQPCAVLLEPREVDSPVGRNPGRRLDTDLWPDLYLYAERSAMAAVFAAADERAMELLHGQRIGLADIEATGFRAAPLESDELPGDVWHIFRRYRVQMSHHIQEV